MDGDFHVGEWLVQPGMNRIRGPEGEVHLEPKVMDVLVYLARHSGEVLPKDRIIEAVWPDTFVTDDVLIRAISELRKAFGHEGKDSNVIKTIPRRGYRLVLPVAFLKEEAEPRKAEDADLKKPIVRPGSRFLLIAVAGILVLAAILTALLDVFDYPSSPRITKYTQLTESQVFFPPVLSPIPMVSDGSRIYFLELIGGQFAVRQVADTGGDAIPFETPFSEWLLLCDISPDGSRLLIGVRPPRIELGLWLLPLVGGSPQRVGDLTGHAGTWSPTDGKILYANGSDLYLARSDGTESRRILRAPGRVYWPRFSPDGSRIRFSATSPKRYVLDLWEATADGADLRRVLPEWNDPPDQCCGSWTPDGKYYIFQATRNHRTQLWAIREELGSFEKRQPKPVQLTTGAMDFIRPLIGPDGKTIFAIGWQLRGELSRYDRQSGQFASYLSGISAEEVVFSRDCEWISYVSYPEADLWRAGADGSQRRQLTFPPVRAVESAWSPDGKTIAFVGQLPEQYRKIYLIPADGGTPQPLTAEDRYEASPSWSPDGNRLAFSLEGDEGIQIIELKTGTADKLANSENVHEPDWSPDGRYIAAHTRDHQGLVLFDLATQRSDLLVEIDVGRQYWSPDGKYLYVVSPWWLGPRRAVYRVRVPDGNILRMVGLKDIRQAAGVHPWWVGFTPEGSPLLLRDHSIHHIYALDLEY